MRSHLVSCPGSGEDFSLDPQWSYADAQVCKELKLVWFGYFKIHFASCILAYGATRVASITHLCWCNWRTFWRKNSTGRSPRGSCSCMTMPLLTGHLQPRRNWPTWASNVLITHTILWIWPRQTEKTIGRSPFFIQRKDLCCHRDLVGRTTF